jgi:hypothetical protein
MKILEAEGGAEAAARFTFSEDHDIVLSILSLNDISI